MSGSSDQRELNRTQNLSEESQHEIFRCGIRHYNLDHIAYIEEFEDKLIISYAIKDFNNRPIAFTVKNDEPGYKKLLMALQSSATSV